MRDLTPAVWRQEPFRLFFPLGLVLGWCGIGHWITYWAGVTATYSCLAHGLVQVQGFLLAFALGFLLTALPRRTESPPAPMGGIVLAGAGLVAMTVAALLEVWWIAEGVTVALVVGLIGFAVRRLLAGAAGTRRPPAAFVLLPLGFACAIVGAGCVVWGTSGSGPLSALPVGRLLLEQGFFLCLVMGAGALVLPLMDGQLPPPDLGSHPAVTRAALGYAGAGILVVASIGAEALAGSTQWAPIARGLVVAVVLVRGAGIARPLTRPGWNRRVTRLAAWLVPTGFVLAGIAPDVRVALLHVTFLGGFGLLAVGVATHVTASHLDLPEERDGRSRAVAIVTVAMLAALIGRITADFTATYFEHLAYAGAVWIVGSAVWAARMLPRWWRV